MIYGDYFLTLLAGSVVFVLLVAIADMKLNTHRKRKRTAGIALVARNTGLQFSASDIFNIPECYKHYPWIDQGVNRCASNIVYGIYQGYKIKAFDYDYNTEIDPDFSSFFIGSIVVIDSDCRFPALFVCPKMLGGRLTDIFGVDGIDFGSYEFNRSFYVTSSDEKFAHDVFHPRMMDFLLANKGWTFEMVEGSIMLYDNRRFAPERFEDNIKLLYNFVELLPDHLRQKLQRRSA